MSERTANRVAAFRRQKIRVLEMIKYYRDNHPTIYVSFEKSCHYDWAIDEAYNTVARSTDAPMEVLDRLLSKYDGWAHTNTRSSWIFSVAASAIEDLIDHILTG